MLFSTRWHCLMLLMVPMKMLKPSLHPHWAYYCNLCLKIYLIFDCIIIDNRQISKDFRIKKQIFPICFDFAFNLRQSLLQHHQSLLQHQLFLSFQLNLPLFSSRFVSKTPYFYRHPQQMQTNIRQQSLHTSFLLAP